MDKYYLLKKGRKRAMRKKYTSKTYMRGVSDWDLVVLKRKSENYYLSIKRVNQIDEAFSVNVSGQNIIYIDNGYYIMEFTPLNQFYNVRVFLDKNADVIAYYFDISRGNGVEQNIPYYDDLYLDIIYCPVDSDFIAIDDEDELLDALNHGKITDDEFVLSKDVCSNLVKEIQDKRNIFVNMDKKDLIQRYFNM